MTEDKIKSLKSFIIINDIEAVSFTKKTPGPYIYRSVFSYIQRLDHFNLDNFSKRTEKKEIVTTHFIRPVLL